MIRLSGFSKRGRSRSGGNYIDYEARWSQCDVPGCTFSTRERKPFCPEHIERLPYVADLLLRIEGRAMADLAVARRAKAAQEVDISAETPREILRFLWLFGGRSEEGMARLCGLDIAVVSGYVSALLYHKLVRRTLGLRGQEIIVLTCSSQRASVVESTERGAAC